MVTHTLATGWPVLMSVTLPERVPWLALAGVEVRSSDAAMRAKANRGLKTRMGGFSSSSGLGPGNVKGARGSRPRVLHGKHDIETVFAQCSAPDEALDRGVGVLVVRDAGHLIDALADDDQAGERSRAAHPRHDPPGVRRGVPELGSRERREVAAAPIFGPASRDDRASIRKGGRRLDQPWVR